MALDGLLPAGWDHEEGIRLSDEESGLRLRELGLIGSATAAILVMSDDSEPASTRGSLSQRAAAAGPVHLRGALEPHIASSGTDARCGRAGAGPYTGGRGPSASARQAELYDALWCQAAEAAGCSICQSCNRRPAASELEDMECWECFSEH